MATAQQPASGAGNFLRLILVPTDFSPKAEPALRWARALAAAVNAEIVLLHVLDLITPALAAASPDGSVWIDDQLLQRIREETDAAMTKLAATFSRTKALVRDGTPREVILGVADEIHADLIVMGTHGRTGLAHVLLGSVAEHVVRHSRIPVLTVRDVDA